MMNEYSYNDMTVGLTEVFDTVITQEKLDMFQCITGDNNPLHTDKSYASSQGYNETVAYGMLTASFLSTLAGVYLPGKKSLIHSVETKFKKPVMVGDQLKITGEVVECNDHFSVITLKVKMENQKGEKVLQGKMKVGILDE